jgi:WWE domain
MIDSTLLQTGGGTNSFDYSKGKGNLINISECVINNVVYYTFSWKSNDDPFDENQTPIWTEYPQNIQRFLSTEYKKYKSDGSNSQIILISPLNSYSIDFKSLMQKKIDDPYRIRPIKIDEKSLYLKEIKNKKFGILNY